MCVSLCVATYLQVSQKRVSDSLELEVQAIGSSLADAGSWTPAFLTAGQLSSPQNIQFLCGSHAVCLHTHD